MAKFDSTVSTLAIAALVAVGISGLVSWSTGGSRYDEPAPTPVATAPAPVTPAASAESDTPAQPRPLWAASATGRIEPRDGEIRIVPQLAGRVAEVAVKVNDRVAKGDLLVRLDDEDARLKVAAAAAEAEVRKLERDEEQAKGMALDRRKAEDALSDARRALFQARMRFDKMTSDFRAGKAAADDVTRARSRVDQGEQRVENERANLARLVDSGGMPLQTRLESALTIARTDLSAAESAVEKMHIRAPADANVLNVQARVGELAAPVADVALVTIGDLSAMKVRAEVEERDATKVRAGQRVVVRADAFPGKDFEGVVTSVAPSLGTPRIAVRGPRRPSDVEVLEVQADLDGTPPLLTGMRVDVFFKLDKTAEQGAATR